MSVLERLRAERGEEEPRPPTKPKAAKRENGHTTLFGLANDVDTIRLLDLLSIEHDGKHATCPECGEPGALICENGGLKCLHDRCGDAGPANFRGFRNPVALVEAVKRTTAKEAAEWICHSFNVPIPEWRANDTGAEEPPPGRFDDDEEGSGAIGAPRNDGVASVAAAVEWHGARAIFAALPATKWLVRELLVCPGRPTLWCGYGYVGKTLTAQAQALAIACGVPVFGKFNVPRGVVRHFDHEQGRHATFKRYQRAAIGMGLESAEADGHLFVTVFPQVFLNMPGAADVYARLCEGTDFAIIDALRGATPGEDENDSKIRRCLDNLTIASEKTGTVFQVIHHTGKPQEGHNDQRTKPRGSSGIFDACGPVFLLSGSKESPHKLVSQQKAPAEAEGSAVDDFFLTVDDVSHGFNSKAGVRVTYRSKDEILAAAAPPPTDLGEHDRKIVELIRANPGTNVRALRGLARPMRNGDIDDAIGRLEVAGLIDVRAGARGAKEHFPKEGK